MSKTRSKKIEQLLSKVKQITQKEKKSDEPLAIMPPAIIQSKTDTFMTSCNPHHLVPTDEFSDDALLRQYEDLAKNDKNFGLGGKKKKKGQYDSVADEVLEDLDQHERDMNDMLKYLQEVDDMIKGQDLQTIQQMMDVTKDTMSQHFEAYDKFKGQIDTINLQADAAINSLNFYENLEAKSKEAIASAKTAKKVSTQLERVTEENGRGEDDEAENLSAKKPKKAS